MPRGLDHLVHAVHDLDKARAVYERLGFTLTPEARHPFGTKNSLVQLDGCFLELLAIADTGAFPEEEAGAFSFPGFNAGFLDRHEGISMLALESEDAADDRAAFAEANLRTYRPFEFGRDARQPDGSTGRVGFKLTFTSAPEIPGEAFFTCQHLAPDLFWKDEYREHANTAGTIREVMMVAEKPNAHWAFFEAFVGTDDVKETDTGILIDTGRGAIRVDEPGAVAESWGTAIDVKQYDTPRFAGYVIGVGDMEKAGAALEGGGIEHFSIGDRLVVPDQQAFGAAIAFEPVGG
ncbi:VOC family protein [Microbaculum marinum]|uniref:VOC family protein n=1 Tax=Microbaculum marinum TaxID=1764581 RepID=A0AAW9RSI3_9HYPH